MIRSLFQSSEKNERTERQFSPTPLQFLVFLLNQWNQQCLAIQTWRKMFASSMHSNQRMRQQEGKKEENETEDDDTNSGSATWVGKLNLRQK